MIKKLPALFILFLLSCNSMFASHIMGGEITWECNDSGKFIFQLVLYRDCNGVDVGLAPRVIYSNSPVTSIHVNYVSSKDISPGCNPDSSLPHLNCNTTAPFADTGAVSEFIFRSDPIAIHGVPPPAGWTFWWTNCCRNGVINNLSIELAGYTLRSKMYPFNGQNTFPCFDNSPSFLERPPQVTCIGYPFAFNNNAVDMDYDSLTYDWADPLNDDSPPMGPAIPFISGYSYDSPLPSTFVDARNKAAKLNPRNGEITFTSFTRGTFVACTKVSSKKCGIVVAEIFRDMEIALKTCEPLRTFPSSVFNAPPEVQPPITDSLGIPVYNFSVVAGDTICFPIDISDLDMNSLFQYQTLHLETSGLGFESCPFPPCATVMPDPETATGSMNITFQFCWITSCDHIRQDTACPLANSTYNFVFKVFDDYCPVPGLTSFTASITITAPPGTPPAPSVIQSGDTLFASVLAASYQWYLDGNILTGENSIWFIPVLTGNYAVEAIPLAGCRVKSSGFHFVSTRFLPDDYITVEVYPNPLKDHMYLHAISRKNILADVDVTDGLGRSVHSSTVESQNGEHTFEFNWSRLSSGIYLLRFRSEFLDKTFKLVKLD